MSRNFYFLLTKTGSAVTNLPSFAPVAQLDRAPGFEPVGRRFESCRARQIGFWGIGVMPLVRLAPLFRYSYIPVVFWACSSVGRAVDS